MRLVVCDSCGASDQVREQQKHPEGWWWVSAGLRTEATHNGADLCAACFERAWSSITIHRRMHNVTPTATCSCAEGPET